MALCEENCELIEYNYIKEKAKCSCDIKVSIPSNFDIKFNKNDFFKSFTDINSILNLSVMKCYKIVLKITSLKNNYGFFIIAFIFVFYFATLLIFITSSFDKLKFEIKKIISILKLNDVPIKRNKMKKPIVIRNKTKKKAKKFEKEMKNKNISDKNNINKKIDFKYIKKVEKENYFSNIFFNDQGNSNFNMEPIKEENIYNNNEFNNNILEKKDFELNLLDYEEAINFDNRNYFEYYLSLLKNNHPLMFSFSSYNDYNSKIIKIFLFFFSFCLDLTINALFFTDDTMHKIYQDKGQFNFLYQIPQILYSTFISRFIDSLIKNFSLSQDILVELKQEMRKDIIDQRHKKIIFMLKIKFSLFFIFSFLFLIFCWYYLTCFCCIYINTQIHLFKDSLSSLITSLFIPFVLYLIPGIFRIISLKVRKPSRKYLYKFSLFLDNYIC